jgi:hypothetical protein
MKLDGPSLVGGGKQSGFDLVQEFQVSRMELDMEFSGRFGVGQGLANDGFDELRGDGDVGDHLSSDGKGEGDEGLFGIADDLRNGGLEGTADAIAAVVR